MYRYGLHTVRHVVFELWRIPPSSSCSSDEASPRRNGRRRSVPATKQQATKCIRDQMAGAKVSPPRNDWRRSVPAMKRRRRNSSDETSCSVIKDHLFTCHCFVCFKASYNFIVVRLELATHCLQYLADLHD